MLSSVSSIQAMEYYTFEKLGVGDIGDFDKKGYCQYEPSTEKLIVQSSTVRFLPQRVIPDAKKVMDKAGNLTRFTSSKVTIGVKTRSQDFFVNITGTESITELPAYELSDDEKRYRDMTAAQLAENHFQKVILDTNSPVMTWCEESKPRHVIHDWFHMHREHIGATGKAIGQVEMIVSDASILPEKKQTYYMTPNAQFLMTYKIGDKEQCNASWWDADPLEAEHRCTMSSYGSCLGQRVESTFGHTLWSFFHRK